MDVSNRSCIRRLSGKALWADRKRVLISILAIALTALLTTSLFTVLLSINESYQSYTSGRRRARPCGSTPGSRRRGSGPSSAIATPVPSPRSPAR